MADVGVFVYFAESFGNKRIYENNKNATVTSTGNSKVEVYVIPTDEEMIIAKSTKELFINPGDKK